MRPCTPPLVLAIALAGVATWAPPVASAPGPPAPVIQPAVDLGGLVAPRVGVEVRASRGVWSGAPETYRITWEVCAGGGDARCAPVGGAVDSAYTPRPEDTGRALRARVEATGPGGTAVAHTAATPLVEVVGTGGASRVPSAARVGGVGAPRGLPLRIAVTVGARARLTGHLADAPIATQVILRDPRGVEMARSDVRPDGRFRLSARVTRGGLWTVHGPTGAAGVRMALRPRVVLTSVPRALRTPSVVAVRGRLIPAVYAKVVELHYLDPGRGWRLWKQARTDGAGRFVLARTLPRSAAAPRFRLRVRVAVPADRGSPFAPAVSDQRVLAVR